MIEILAAHAIARREGKPPFFFSRFNFTKMKECGNTHFCFACMARGGYLPDHNGMPTNVQKDDVWSMKEHTRDHKPFVIGDADKYKDVWSWLEAKITPEFPFIVVVPRIP